MATIDLWGWFDGLYWDSIREGKAEQIRLIEFFYHARAYMETMPQQAVMLLQQARDLAVHLNEPYLKLFYDYWITEAYLFYIDDQKTGLDLAVRTAVEARKPLYEHCPVRARVFRALVDAYMIRDPIGYADKIAETTEFMQREIPLDEDTEHLLQARRVGLAFAFDRLDEAIQEALRFLAITEHSDFQQTSAYGMLCRFHYLKGDLDAAEQYAAAGEQCAQRSERKGSLASLLAWKALFSRKRGEIHYAELCYQLATSKMKALGRTPYSAYYEALCDYHELAGEPEKALVLRDQQLAEAIASTSPHGICETRLKRCELLKRMKHPALNDELTAARDAAKALLKPAHFLAKLDRVITEDAGGEMPNT